MSKRQLTITEAFDLRQALHVAVLDALMASRRWEPGDLVFQGGTSLHLAHGSPRFSEDLDFLVNSALKLDAIGEAVAQRLSQTGWIPDDTALRVSKARDDHNPHAFVVSIGGADVIGAVRVKVELWQTDKSALSGLKTVIAPVRLSRGPAAGMQAFVPTADLTEIYADKVFALAARPYLKPRDVFDLHWLCQGHAGPLECTVDALQARLRTYPSETPSAWLQKAFERRAELSEATDKIAVDLARWLPASWPMNKDSAAAMAHVAITALDQGIDAMREVQAQLDNESPSP